MCAPGAARTMEDTKARGRALGILGRSAGILVDIVSYRRYRGWVGAPPLSAAGGPTPMSVARITRLQSCRLKGICNEGRCA